MKRARPGMMPLICGIIMFVELGFAIRIAPMVDFKEIYNSSRCLLQHSDPYLQDNVERVYRAGDGYSATESPVFTQVATLNVNLPTALLFASPFAALPWGPAHLAWMVLTAISVSFAGVLVWRIGLNSSPGVAGAQVLLLLSGSEILIEIGNAAGILTSLCVVALWCFVRERFVIIGVLCFAVSLAVKPHNAGLIWVFLLLAGGAYRRYAVKILLATLALGAISILWVSQAAPDWAPEFLHNRSLISAPGGMDSLGPDIDNRYHGGYIVSLQTVTSIFWRDPKVYNSVVYLICAPLLLIWVFVTWRSRLALSTAWLALATIVALSLLPIYHRQHDTRLLLLTIPACAMLWAERGIIGWLALLVNSAGVVLTGDLWGQGLAILGYPLYSGVPGLSGKLLTALLARPAPLALLVMAIFYLSVYVMRISGSGHSGSKVELAKA